MGTAESVFYEGSPPEEPNLNRSRLSSHDLSEPSSTRSPPPAAATRSSLRRPRPPPNITTLRGLVLGLPSSGKRTLLKRLKGKDPFEAQEDSEDVDVSSIKVPYQPPGSASVWDRIQLCVELSAQETPHFCVVLVNPRHDPKRIREYITSHVVATLMERAPHADTSHPPICLCVLLNFRDLRASSQASERIQIGELRDWAEKAFENHSSVNGNRLVLQVGTTSLRNCFGLDGLHHFIYRAYLQWKEYEMERRLLQIRYRIKDASTVPSTSYGHFLDFLRRTQGAEIRASTPDSDAARTRPRPEITQEENLDKAKSKPSPETAKKDLPNSKRAIASRVPSRPVMPPKPYADPKKTLDAFFADDEDNMGDVTTTKQHMEHSMQESDDDEDDDFFYDETGKRHEHPDDGIGGSKFSGREAPGSSRLPVRSMVSIAEKQVKKQNAIEPAYSSLKKDAKRIVKPPGEEDGKNGKDVIETEAVEISTKDRISREQMPVAKENTSNVEDEGWSDDDLELEDDTEQNKANGSQDVPSNEAPRHQATWASHEQVETKGKLINKRYDYSAKARGSPNEKIEDDEHDSEIENDRRGTEEPPDAHPQKETINTRQSLHSEFSIIQEQQVISAKATSSGENSKGGRPHMKQVQSTTRNATANEPDVGKGEGQKPSHKSVDTEAESDEEEEFMIDERTSSATRYSPGSTRLFAQEAGKASRQERSAPSESSTTGGVSAAALAAIAAAEKEAQLMFEASSVNEKNVKKAKKKKDPDGKKKKKKKKKKVAVASDSE